MAPAATEQGHTLTVKKAWIVYTVTLFEIQLPDWKFKLNNIMCY